MNHEIELVLPAKAHEGAAKAYYREHLDAGEGMLHGSRGLDRTASYDEWLAKIGEASEIRSITFFAIRKSDNKIIGTINIRYPYEGYVRINGHIGYGIRPGERKKGYATAMLGLALAHCKDIGLTKVLLVCDAANEASERTIVKCSGVLEGESLQEDGCLVRRYWIQM